MNSFHAACHSLMIAGYRLPHLSVNSSNLAAAAWVVAAV